MRFDEFELDEQLLDSISYLGFNETTPIQEQAIPKILNGHDLIACAQTGTGKTAAFLLPVLNALLINNVQETNALIIVPTRELAVQIDQQIQGIGYMANIDSAVVYGGGDGSNWDQEKRALTKGARVIVATPGKLLSHLKLGHVNFSKITHLVLDEADRMLDIGFKDDLLRIMSFLPKERQTLMFSATMPPKIKTFSQTILKDPEEVTLAMSKPAEGVLQAAYLAHEEQKTPLIDSLIKDKPEYSSILIFCSTKRKVSQLARHLMRKKYKVEGLTSDLEQSQREEILGQFKARQLRILVATDVLSRGVDIKDINLVINYDVPGDAEDYVHRVGRTARAETTGVALTLVNTDDMYKLAQIERLIEREVPKLMLPPEIGEGPEWRVSQKKYSGKRNNFKKRKPYKGKKQ
ncbi:MAG: DEAD/DEAH box helicase [Bacteroidota bacterium]